MLEDLPIGQAFCLFDSFMPCYAILCRMLHAFGLGKDRQNQNFRLQSTYVMVEKILGSSITPDDEEESEWETLERCIATAVGVGFEPHKGFNSSNALEKNLSMDTVVPRLTLGLELFV